MKTKRKRWKQEEIDLLVQTIECYNYNRKEAFRIVSEYTNRTVQAVSQKWYSEVRTSSKCFISIGKNSEIIVNGSSYAPLKKKGVGPKPVSSNPKEILELVMKLLNSINL